MTGRIFAAALLALCVLNLLSFGLMGYDKRRARLGQWRIPEKTLFLAAACFGAAGGLLGMRVFRHKTRHTAFRIGFPALLAVQILLLGWAAAAFLL